MLELFSFFTLWTTWVVSPEFWWDHFIT
jgi:hypothetical protein